MSDGAFRDALFEQFARVGQALSSPVRVEILYVLNQGDKTVEQLARATRVPVANASHHLQKLKEARLVTARKKGLYVVYSLASPEVEALWQSLQATGQDRLAELRDLVRTHTENRDELEAVTRKELKDRLKRGEVVVLDVRPEDEYRAGHLPGAVSIPPDAWEERMKELPQGKTIVAYCRGPYCLISYDAVETLRNKGFKALRLEDGFPEWKANHLPIEKGGPERKRLAGK